MLRHRGSPSGHDSCFVALDQVEHVHGVLGVVVGVLGIGGVPQGD